MNSKKEAVVFLASGGLDSTVGMAKAIEELDVVVYPLYIERGAQADAMERRSLGNVYDELKRRYPENLMPVCFERYLCPPPSWKQTYCREDVLRLGYPMRDIVLQSVGVQYAEYLNALAPAYVGHLPNVEELSIRQVMVGQTSDEVLPHATEYALRFASYYVQIDRDDESWAICSPLLFPELMTKADVVRWGDRHEIPMELTWSCFRPGPTPCHVCQGCELREQAFAAVEGRW